MISLFAFNSYELCAARSAYWSQWIFNTNWMLCVAKRTADKKIKKKNFWPRVQSVDLGWVCRERCEWSQSQSHHWQGIKIRRSPNRSTHTQCANKFEWFSIFRRFCVSLCRSVPIFGAGSVSVALALTLAVYDLIRGQQNWRIIFFIQDPVFFPLCCVCVCAFIHFSWPFSFDTKLFGY